MWGRDPKGTSLRGCGVRSDDLELIDLEVPSWTSGLHTLARTPGEGADSLLARLLERIKYGHMPGDIPARDGGLLPLLLSRFSHVQLCATHRQQPTRLPRPWDSPGKNTGVGCHFLLQCVKVKSEREVTQSCPTLRDHMDCSPPGSSVHGIFQARTLEWGAIVLLRGKW